MSRRGGPVERLRNGWFGNKPDGVGDRPPIEDFIGSIDADAEDSWVVEYSRALELNVYAPLRIALRDWRAWVGFFLTGVFRFMSTAWYRLDVTAPVDVPRTVGPFDRRFLQTVYGIEVWHYPLGTTQEGEDLLRLIVMGAPPMLEILVAGTVISSGAAILIGITAGYKGGTVDRVLMMFTDGLLATPSLPLIVLFIAVLSPQSNFVLGALLALDHWPGFARSLRSQVLTIREESYVEASRAMGVSTISIVKNDLALQLMPYILINLAESARRMVVMGVAVYFIGFGPPVEHNWGALLYQGTFGGTLTYSETFHIFMWPSIVITAMVFGFVLAAQSMDEIFNPRLRARHAKYNDTDIEDLP